MPILRRPIPSLPPARAARRQHGGALLEAMVGLLIFLVGVVGLVGLQATMSRAQTVAKFRADASYLATEVVGAMWADRANLAGYVTSPGSACAGTTCAAWVSKVGTTLPSGAATVTVDTGTGDVAVTLTWSPPDEGTRTYVLNTTIR